MARIYYSYEPSLAASTIFLVIYGLSTIHHLYKLVAFKTWYFIPFWLGVLFQVIGFIAKDISIQQAPKYELVPFVIQTVFILVAPALYAASLYMMLGRIVRLLDAEVHSIIRSTWVTKIFVLGDILSFVIQGIGGSIISTADNIDRVNVGKNFILAGLGIQIFFFSLFLVVTLVFQLRMRRKPTPRSLEIVAPWGRLIIYLFVASGLILIRSVFRMAEYAGGISGELYTNEVYFYVFDATLMVLVAILFNVWHPCHVLSPKKEGESLEMGSVNSGSARKWPLF